MSIYRGAALAALICSSLAVFPVPAVALTTIDTGQDVQQSSICNWGFPDTSTYGQTFVAPTVDTKLDQFSFHMIRGGDVTATIAYRAFVYEWDADRVVGSAVWQGSVQEATLTSADALAPHEVGATTGGVVLEAGETYLAFLSTSLDYEQNDELDTACYLPGANAYAGGTFWFNNDAGDEYWWTEPAWDSSMNLDLAFEATFTQP
jgi:hypothetical protein